VSEIFTAICGEGSEVGLPATFLRTSGCNLRCPGWPCDTPYTSVQAEGEWLTTDQVLDRVRHLGLKRVFITGGEPLLWAAPLTTVARSLRCDGYSLILQSNGTLEAPDLLTLCDLISLDCKTPSSGEESSMEVIAKTIASYRSVQVKFVISDDADLRFALDCGQQLLPLPGGTAVRYCAHPRDHVGTDDAASLLRKLQWLQERVLEGKHDWLRVLPQVHVLVHGSAVRGV
jgi:7-cyano-7-deazaguanosine (preQ0) biosynthesis protein QueE